MITPTRAEKAFNRFLQTIHWGFPVRIKWNRPLQTSDGRTLFPDFRFEPSRLIIEIDGSVHLSLALDRDCRRDFWLEERGFKVLHLSNDEASTMTAEKLADKIIAIYPSFPHPTEQMDTDLKAFRERSSHPNFENQQRERIEKFVKVVNKPLNSKKYKAAPSLTPTMGTENDRRSL